MSTGSIIVLGQAQNSWDFCFKVLNYIWTSGSGTMRCSPILVVVIEKVVNELRESGVEALKLGGKSKLYSPGLLTGTVPWLNKHSSHTSHQGQWRGCWQECKLVQPLWKTVRRFLKKLKLELPNDPAIPLLGIDPHKTVIWKDICTPMFISALFTKAKIRKQAKCPSTDEWIKMWYIHIMENYSTIKKNKKCHLQQLGCNYRLSY